MIISRSSRWCPTVVLGEAKAKPKRSAKRKAKAKTQPKAKGKRRRDDDDEPTEGHQGESFASEFVDCLGHTRLTLFGDDLLNAVNFTLEKVPAKNLRRDAASFAIDLGVVFAFTGKLDAIQQLQVAKSTAWTKARIQIKSYLNRTHSLQARHSDPELPTMADVGADEQNEIEEEQSEEEDVQDSSLTDLVTCVKAINEKNLISFLEDNFSRLADDDPNVPTVASVMEDQPGMVKVVNKMKKFAKNKLGSLFPQFGPEASFGALTSSSSENLTSGDTLVTIMVTELVEIVASIFEPGFMELTGCLVSMQQGDARSTDHSFWFAIKAGFGWQFGSSSTSSTSVTLVLAWLVRAVGPFGVSLVWERRCDGVT